MKKERIEEIAELLDKRGKLTLEQLDEHFPNVSQMTIRRDLLQLEQEGRVIRVRGGAMSVKEVQKVSGESYTRKIASQTDEKITIAQKAASLVEENTSIFMDGGTTALYLEENSSIFMDGGTTALYLAKELPDIDIHVFTNGLAVAIELAKKKNMKVTMLGGQVMPENLSTSSPSAKMYFENTNFELAIISASAFTPEDGFSCGSQVEADLLILAHPCAEEGALRLYDARQFQDRQDHALYLRTPRRHQRAHHRRQLPRRPQSKIRGREYRCNVKISPQIFPFGKSSRRGVEF